MSKILNVVLLLLLVVSFLYKPEPIEIVKDLSRGIPYIMQGEDLKACEAIETRAYNDRIVTSFQCNSNRISLVRFYYERERTGKQ